MFLGVAPRLTIFTFLTEKNNNRGHMTKIPAHYLQGLSTDDRSKHRAHIIRSRRMAKRGKYPDRPKLKSFTSRPSRHTTNFAARYGFRVTDLRRSAHRLKVPVTTQRAILRKGRGAYFSSGSRSNQTNDSWAYARLASTLLGRKACKVDAHLLPPSRQCATLRRMARA